MRDLKKEDFVGKMTYYGPIVDAGYDLRIKGSKADQFSFAIDYGYGPVYDGTQVWMCPACAIIDVMARESDKWPHAIEWQEWFYGKLGLTTWQLRARDGFGGSDDEGDFDADDDDKPAPKADRRLRLPGDEIVTNHVPTVYDKAVHQAYQLLLSLDIELLQSLDQTPAALKAAIESKGFVWSEKRGYHIPVTTENESEAATPVQKTMF